MKHLRFYCVFTAIAMLVNFFVACTDDDTDFDLKDGRYSLSDPMMTRGEGGYGGSDDVYIPPKTVSTSISQDVEITLFDEGNKVSFSLPCHMTAKKEVTTDYDRDGNVSRTTEKYSSVTLQPISNSGTVGNVKYWSATASSNDSYATGNSDFECHIYVSAAYSTTISYGNNQCFVTGTARYDGSFAFERQ